MTRRMFLRAVSASSIFGCGSRFVPAAFAADAELDDIRNNWQALLAPNSLITLSTEPVRKSKAEWQQSLNRLQFAVLREESTEPPPSGRTGEGAREAVELVVFHRMTPDRPGCRSHRTARPDSEGIAPPGSVRS